MRSRLHPRRAAPAAAALALLLVLGCQGRGDPGRPLRAGFMICNSLAETRARFGPLVAHLQEQLGRRVEPVWLDTADFEGAVREGELDLIHTNSLLYVWFHELYGYEILAGESRGRHGPYSSGTIIARAEGPVRTLEDLRGRRFVFGPAFAPTAYLTPYWLMLEAGIDPELDLGFYAFPSGSFKHEKAILSVLDGAFDAGAGPSLDLELMEAEGMIAPGEYHVVAEGPLVPYCVFSVAPGVPAGVREKIRTVLFALVPGTVAAVDGEILKVLKSAGADGFVPLQDGEFDRVREMARRCNMPPYAEY